MEFEQPMAGNALLLNISEMIDLAIGTPEIGVVDFCMLQTVLHLLAQQLCVREKNVELRGSVANLPVGRENPQTIAISEYIVETEPQNPDAKKLVIQQEKKSDEPETLLIVERVRKSGSRGHRPIRETVPGPVTTTPAVSSPQPVGVSTERLSLVTLSKFNLLEDMVEDLKNRVYGSMPKNEDILEEVRSQTNLKAITDMWTSLNVSSRLEAAEAGLAKLSSLVQDLIKETSGLQSGAVTSPSSTGVPGTTESVIMPEDVAAIMAHMERLRADLDQLTQTFYKTMQEMKDGFGRRKSDFGRDDTELMTRINDLEKRLQKCCDSIMKAEGIASDQISNIQDQLDQLMKQVASLNEDLAAGKLSPDLIKDLQGLMELFQTVQEMQQQLKQVHETALHLAAEKEDRQSHMNALLEQIEILKTIKLDREDMVEAMADKADMRMLARKVSHDQFELACDDLSRGLEHALGKLNMQESLWQQALDDIQREIETKLDKMELSPVKDFFSNKLKQLQDNLKQMASLRREAEAAGTKRRLLRDVNCISCDAQAVMPMDAAATASSKPLPGHLSMKPYLSYELDTIRKTQQANVPQRNLHDWETIDKQMSQPKQPQKVRSETDKHICNRYCGGSHTVTTPAQRVARLGHFIKQWGPDVVPLSSGFATGDDGRLYKVSQPEGVTAGPGGAVDQICTKKPKEKEPLKAPGKPLGLNAECRCLEGDYPSKG